MIWRQPQCYPTSVQPCQWNRYGRTLRRCRGSDEVTGWYARICSSVCQLNVAYANSWWKMLPWTGVHRRIGRRPWVPFPCRNCAAGLETTRNQTFDHRALLSELRQCRRTSDWSARTNHFTSFGRRSAELGCSDSVHMLDHELLIIRDHGVLGLWTLCGRIPAQLLDVILGYDGLQEVTDPAMYASQIQQ